MRFCYISTVMAGLFAAVASQALALDPRADLEFMQVTPKEKCTPNGCFIQSFTVYINNSGLTDASNTTLECYSSADGVLDTDPASPTADTLLKRVSLGKIKAESNKKKTLGGGLFKKISTLSGTSYFFVIDRADIVDERNENNTLQYAIIN